MITAFALACGDLADRRILAILVRSLGLTLLLFAALGVVAAWLLAGADPCAWLGVDSCTLGLGAGSFGAILLLLVGLWFLFPAIALGVITAYMDRVVGAVEARHYPAAAAAARPLGLVRGAGLGLASSLRVLAYNLVAAPFYILLLVTGIGPLLLFVAVNGAAFGRDLALMVAIRHGGWGAARAWAARVRGDRLLLGSIVTALFLLPFVNLIAPIVGAAAATHLYHRRRPDPGSREEAQAAKNRSRNLPD